MNRRVMNTFVVCGSLAALVAVGCASTQTAKMTPAESVAERQKLMKGHGDTWKSIQDKAKAGNVEGIGPDARKLAASAKQIPALFPPGSLEGKTAAKPEIWQKWSDFEAAAKNMEVESVKLAEASEKKDANATQAIVKDFGRKTCGNCHQSFRVPPKT
jgi:cytochrome c556